MANALEHVGWESCFIEPQPDRALRPTPGAGGGFPIR